MMADAMSPASSEHIRVDVVVSDAAVRESTRILLEVHGYPASDYASGSEYILGDHPHSHCVLTDYDLSDMTGFELLEHLRTRGDKTPVVMMTGRIDGEVVSRAGSLSILLLEKPPLSDSLVETIAKACRAALARGSEAPPATAARFPASFDAAEEQSPSWIDTAGTGVAIFDAEHRELNEMVIDLYDAILSGASKDALDDLFGNLAHQATDHFAHEENYMRFSDYPESARHIEAHNRLTKALISVPVIEVQEGDRAARALELLRFLRDWLMEHILTDDRNLGAHLNSRGIR
jgi:hemerythrin-like metal-binding protein